MLLLITFISYRFWVVMLLDFILSQRWLWRMVSSWNWRCTYCYPEDGSIALLRGVNKILTHIASQNKMRFNGVRADVGSEFSIHCLPQECSTRQISRRRQKIWFVFEVSVNNRDERQLLISACAKCVCTLYSTPFSFLFTTHHVSGSRVITNCLHPQNRQKA
jgi:hypothetical protein